MTFAGKRCPPRCPTNITGAEYLIHGTILAAAHCIANDGIRMGDRLHVHFYDCDADGRAVGGRTVRIGSEVAIAVSAQKCMDDGMTRYRAPTMSYWPNDSTDR